MAQLQQRSNMQTPMYQNMAQASMQTMASNYSPFSSNSAPFSAPSLNPPTNFINLTQQPFSPYQQQAYPQPYSAPNFPYQQQQMQYPPPYGYPPQQRQQPQQQQQQMFLDLTNNTPPPQQAKKP